VNSRTVIEKKSTHCLRFNVLVFLTHEIITVNYFTISICILKHQTRALRRAGRAADQTSYGPSSTEGLVKFRIYEIQDGGGRHLTKIALSQ